MRNCLFSDYIRPILFFLVLFTVILGGVYPAITTGIIQLLFPHAATGSLVTQGGKTVGSALIGQSFSAPHYFWGRPSATSPAPYNAASSSGSNLSISNPALLDAVKARIAALKQADPTNNAPVPVDLITASASGLDPEISPAAAYYQISRVAKSRNISETKLRELIAQHSKDRQLGVLGEARVNVLELNLALDGMK
jgi:K+-transporting ATPase ATPase C chain